MKQKLPWVLLGVGLIAGFVIGALSSMFFLNKIGAKILAGGALGEGVRAYSLLQQLRGGGTNEAIERLERDLDISIISTSAGLAEGLPEKDAAASRRMLQTIGQYRRQHPRTNESAELQEQVDAALKSVLQTGETKKESK